MDAHSRNHALDHCTHDALPPLPPRDVVGPLTGYRADKIPLGEIVSRVGGQGQFKAACLEHVLVKAQEDVSGRFWREGC